jgi:cytochrome c553
MRYFPLFLLLTAGVYANNTTTDSMEQLYLKNGCASCHGIYGEGMGATPRLQGQREAVLCKRLIDLKNGKTRTAFGTIMISFAQSLSDVEITQMAHYLAHLKRVVDEERYDPEYDPAGDGGS